MDDGVKLLPEKLKKLRGERPRKDIADKIGITEVTLCRYENGQRTPDAYNLYKLCKFYNVSSDYLIGLENAVSDFDIIRKDNKRLRNKIKQIKRIIGED